MTGTNNTSSKRKRGVPAAEDQDDTQQNNASDSDYHAPKLQKTSPKRKASGAKKARQAPTQPKNPEVDTAASGPEPALRRSSRATDKYATAKGGTAIARSSGAKSLATPAKPGPVRTKANKSTSSSVQTVPRPEASDASSDDGTVTVLAKRSEPPEEPDEGDGDTGPVNHEDDDSDTIVVAMRPRNSVKKSASSSVRPGTFELQEAQHDSVADGIAQQLEHPAESKYRNMRRNQESGTSSFKEWQEGDNFMVAVTSPITVQRTNTVQRSSGVAAESNMVEQGVQLPRRSPRFQAAQDSIVPVDARSPTTSSKQARPPHKSTSVHPTPGTPTSKATNRQRATPTHAESTKAPETPTAPARPRNLPSRKTGTPSASSGTSATISTSLPLMAAATDELSETSETSSDESVSTTSSPKPLPKRPCMGLLNDQFGLRRVEYQRQQQARSDLVRIRRTGR
ncbi:hypothetical protein LTR17_017236 [Elasticomyces elasticus]|nr:hypothetical protein LTR17_017236 [Elasticomyces elasticus]